MFKSTSEGGEPCTDPENIRIERLDGGKGDKWVKIIWEGEDYKDGWFVARLEDIKTLNEMQ